MQQDLENCIFCRIAAGRSPAQIEYSDANVVVFWDIEPHAPVHLLVIPQNHITSLNTTDKNVQLLLGTMITVAGEIAQRKGLQNEGYRLVMNSGANAGQVVDHLHLHILGGGPLGPMTSAQGNPVSQYD